MKTELLIVIPDDEPFCNTKKAFVDFLKIDSLLAVVGQKISYKRTVKSKEIVSARFYVETDKVKSKQERYFILTLDCSEEKNIDDFNELCERIKVVVSRISPGLTAINTLWDDVGRIYAEKSYPIINEVENLMRRLIAKFMLITVGMDWSKDTLQPELLRKIENFKDEQLFINDLHKLDFIHLKQVLFEKKRDIGLDELDRILYKTSFSEGDKEKIRKYSPKSNWDKYFLNLIEEKDHNLDKKWELMYELRNKVAHNRNVKRKEFEQIKGLSSDIKAIIAKATAKLGEIDLDEEDRDLIIYSYNSDSPSAISYLTEKAVAEYYMQLGFLVSSPDNRIAYDYGCDFLAEKDGKTIGVRTRSIRPRTFSSYARMRERTQRDSLLQLPEGMSVIHEVIVLREDNVDFPLNRLFSQVIAYSERSGNKEKVYLGKLNEDKRYIQLEWSEPNKEI